MTVTNAVNRIQYCHPPPLPLLEHPDQQSPHAPILLGVDQKLAERLALWRRPELADRGCSLEVGQLERTEELDFPVAIERLDAACEVAATS
jgi:hypothetical protein